MVTPMKTISRLVVAIAFTAFLLTSGPVGCNATLEKDGVYQGDNILYQAEKATTTAYKTFDSFLRWEQTYRATLPVEVSRAADVIRLNAKKWIDSAIALRDAYAANPTAENRRKLDVALNVIDAALAEATRYLAKPNQ